MSSTWCPAARCCAGSPAQGLAAAAARLGRAGARRRRASTSRPTAPGGCCRRSPGRGAGRRPVPVMGYCMGGTLAVGLAARRAGGRLRRWSRSARPGTSPRPAASPAASAPSSAPQGRRGAEASARRLGRGLRPGAGVAFPDALRADQPDAGGAEVPEAGPARSGQRRGAALRGAGGLAGRRRADAGRAPPRICWSAGRSATAPRRGGWRFLGGPVDPRRVAAPALVFCGERDTIAPPPLAAPLGAAAAAGAHHHGRAPATSAWWSAAPRAPQVWRPAGGIPRRPCRLSRAACFVRRRAG